MAILTRSINIARRCVERNKTYEQYVEYVPTLGLIEHIEIITLDEPAYNAIIKIVHVRKYLK